MPETIKNGLKVSAVIITLNSGQTLEKTLRSLNWCDEIIVVDSGSSDNTQEICLRYNCRFYHHPFNGYGEQKQYATGLASNDWILSIDSDEVITRPLQEEIIRNLSAGDVACAGFMLPISLVFMGKEFRYGKEASMLHLRLYNRRFGGFNDNKLHEKIILNGEIKRLKNIILHNSYRDLAHYYEKFNKFTSFATQDAIRRNKRTGKWQILFKLPATFVVIYFVQLNFLNGFPGFVWSVNSAFYSFVKYLKLYEQLNLKPQ